MKLILTALLLAGLSTTFTGCVSQKHADDQASTIRAYKERVTELQAKIDELNQRISLLQGSGDQLSTLMTERDTLMAQLEKLRQENESLQEQLGNARITGSKYPIEIENDLKAFASQYPDLASFDPITGAVKFASDLTFALGSDQLSPKAAAALAKLATIFNSDTAKSYEVRVVGHTDTLPISRSATRAAHPTNWHLSVHRAISVRDALEKSGVANIRLNVAGYGPYRPAAPNTPRGTEQNRRVEIYLVAMTPVNEAFLTPSGNASGSAPATGSSSDRPAAPGALFK